MGTYNHAKSFERTQSRRRSATIKKEVSPHRRPKHENPEPGQYDGHLTKFGADAKKFTIGGKYRWKPDENPPVGSYNISYS